MTEALEQEIRTLRSLHHSERDPDGRVFAPLADAYRRAGRIPEAVRLLNDGLGRLPEFVPGHVVAAQLYVEQGLAEEAGLAARRALELDPDNVNALKSLLRVLDETGETTEAAGVRDHLMGLEPDFQGELSAITTVTRPSLRAAAPPPVASDGRDALALGALEEVEAEEAGPPEWDQGTPSALESLTLAPEEPTFELGELTVEVDPLPEGADERTPYGDSVLDELAPDPEAVFDLDALSPTEEGPDGQVAGLGLLSVEEPEAVVVDLSGLPQVEPVFDMGALAPDEPEEPVLEMAALAPDEPEEPVLEMSALAPDEPEEPVLEMSALAPDEPEEPVLEMSALAPDEPEEPVLEMTALAPDEPEEPVLEMTALAPDEPEEPVLEMAALAPDEPEEPVLEMAALAPDEPVIDLDALAPDASSERAGDDSVDIGFLSPEPPDEIVIDMDALRPEELGSADEPEGEPASAPSLLPHDPIDATAWPGAEHEEPTEADEGPQVEEPAAEPEASDEPDEGAGDHEEESGEPVYTRTLAELYVKQGAVTRALGVLRHLRAADPDDRELADRIAELVEGVGPQAEPQPESGVPGERRAWKPEGSPEDEEVESLARELAGSGDEGHDVDSPFAWSNHETDAEPPSGPTIRDYFDGLLAWDSEEGE